MKSAIVVFCLLAPCSITIVGQKNLTLQSYGKARSVLDRVIAV